ncbi:MAG TPA: hypothetical protein DEG96_00840 [Candidatus Atribacteria bacterium]|nr:hypothetical protein [Candidatus Atribacteria bacterium]
MVTFESLGVKKVINAAGNNSRLGSSTLSPEVLNAMNEASKIYVNMNELQLRCGEYISKITGADGGLVTSGAAGSLLLAASACITGTNVALILEMPKPAIGKEIIVQKGHRTPYDQAITISGARLVEVGIPHQTYVEQIENAINENTVAFLYTFGETVNRSGEVSLNDVMQISKKYKIPTIVDGSLINYPFTRIKDCIKMGVDLLVTSGGKHIFGPSCTGFICGKKELVEASRLQAFPNYGIGRVMKIGKEEIIGFMTALEIYLKRDSQKEHAEWEDKINYLVSELNKFPYLKTIKAEYDEVNRPVPRTQILIDEKRIKHDVYEIVSYFKENNPPIWFQEFSLHKSIILLNPVCLADGEEEIIVKEFQNLWNLWNLF